MALIGHADVAVYQSKEIRAISGSEVAVPITLAATATDLEKGTVLGMITDSGLFAPYKDSNADGTEVARVILAEYIEKSTVSQLSSAYIQVIAKKDKLVGLDANAITDLGGREAVPGILII